MPKNIRTLTLGILCIFILTSCNNQSNASEGPFAHYHDDKMIGTVSEVANDEVLIDISEWAKRDIKGDGYTDEGYMYLANLTSETNIHFENDNQATVEEIKLGQKVQVNPPRDNGFEGYPDEIILLEMTYNEKYTRLLSHTDVPKVVIMYEEAAPISMDIENMMNRTDTDIVGTKIRYEQDYVVDFKEELKIERFPVILVFNKEKLLFKTYEEEELYEFLENQ